MGGVLHTINPRLFDDQLEYIANHAEDRVLLYDRAFAPLVERMKPQVEDDRALHLLRSARGRDAVSATGSTPRTAIINGSMATSATPLRPLLHQRHDRQSQGRALRASLDHAPHAGRARARHLRPVEARSVVLPIVPMFHANAWGVPWAAPLTGAKLVLSADYRPERMCKLFREEKVTHSAGVPTVWLSDDRTYRAHRRRARRPQAGHHRRLGRAAGDDPLVRERGVEVGHAWGMTETSPIGTCGAPPHGWDEMSDDEQVEYIARQGRVAVRRRAAHRR